MIKATGHEQVYYVSGEVNTETRNALKAMAENGKGIIIVASYGVFSTGISVKNLHHVILAHPVKSKIIVLQTIGRVLRKHKDKSLATVWDIIDDLGVKPKSANAKKKYTHLNYCLKHALERIQRYADEKFNYVMKTVNL
jgi:superfamily II DNA or RNA helicase